MKQSSIEWLFDQLVNRTDKSFFLEELNKAKEMHKQEIIDCAIETTQSCWISAMEALNQELNFTEEDLQNQKDEAEEYYDINYGDHAE